MATIPLKCFHMAVRLQEPRNTCVKNSSCALRRSKSGVCCDVVELWLGAGLGWVLKLKHTKRSQIEMGGLVCGCACCCVCRSLLLFLTRLRDDGCDDNHRCIAMSRGQGYMSSCVVGPPAVSSMIRGTENTNCIGMAWAQVLLVGRVGDHAKIVVEPVVPQIR